MIYPDCDLSADGRHLLSGEVLHRICLNQSSPRYKRQVTSDDCGRCKGLIQEEPDEPEAIVTDKPPKTPNLGRRILTYTQAVAEWIAAGKPERTDEEVQRIFKEHCEKCTWRKKRANICRGCGCRVAAYGMAVTNKIKMATQHCPREKW